MRDKERIYKAIALSIFMLIIGCLGYYSKINGGLEFREFAQTNTKKELGEDGQFAGYWTSCETIVEPSDLKQFRCARDNREIPTLAVVGDSKAAALAAGLFRTSLPGRRWLMLSSRGGGDDVLMPLLSNATVYSKYGNDSAYAALSTLAKNTQIKTVIIAVAIRHLFQLGADDSLDDLPSSPYQEDAEQGLVNFINELLKLNRKIIILVDNPTLAHPEDCISRLMHMSNIGNYFSNKNAKCSISYKEYLSSTAKYRSLLDRMKNRYQNQVSFFETAPFLCGTTDDGICSMTEYGRPNGRPLYSFGDHISDYAAGIIGNAINQFIDSQ